MTSKIARQIACAHPAIITAVFVVCFAAQVMAIAWAVTPIVRGALGVLPMGATCVWWWGIIVVARDGVTQPRSTRWDWLFAAPLLLILIAGLASWPTNNSPAAFVIFFATFLVLFISAKTLEKADAAGGAPSVGRILGTCLLMFAAPFGVWVLHSKITRVAERSPVSAQA